jgi:aspartate 1-decarboxylase
MRIMLKSKLFGLRVADADPKCEGSITLDPEWMRKADILEYEQVHVLDVTNGKRFVTYAIAGEEGDVCVNGAASKLVEIGDDVIVLSYAVLDGSPAYGSFPLPNKVNCR